MDFFIVNCFIKMRSRNSDFTQSDLINHKFLIFLLAYRGTSISKVPKSFRKNGFLAAHCLISSPQGKVNIVTAKNSKNINLTSVDQVQRSERIKVKKLWLFKVFEYGCKFALLSRLLTNPNYPGCKVFWEISWERVVESSSTVNKFYPLIPEAPPFFEPLRELESWSPTPDPIGVKNDYMQQTHIIRAIEKSPILPPDEWDPPRLLSKVLLPNFLSRTKLTSEGSCSRLLVTCRSLFVGIGIAFVFENEVASISGLESMMCFEKTSSTLAPYITIGL